MKFFVTTILILLTTSCRMINYSNNISHNQPVRKEVIEKIFPVNQKTEFSLSNINGDIIVTDWNKDSVKIEAVILDYSDENQLDNVEIKIKNSDNEISVKTEYSEGENHLSVKYRVTAPKYLQISSISGISSSAFIQNMENLERVKSISGNIDLTGTGASSEIETISGNVSLKKCGVSSLNTISGNIKGELTIMEKKAKASSISGNIDLDIPAGGSSFIKASSLSGKVDITELK